MGDSELFSKLDEALSKYASALLHRGFTASGQNENRGFGYAERTYVLDHVLLKAVYERGLTYLELGCALQPGRLVEGSSFRDLIDPPAQGHWNLGMGAAEFLEAHWERIYDLLRPSNWINTLHEIEAVYRSRSNPRLPVDRARRLRTVAVQDGAETIKDDNENPPSPGQAMLP